MTENYHHILCRKIHNVMSTMQTQIKETKKPVQESVKAISFTTNAGVSQGWSAGV